MPSPPRSAGGSGCSAARPCTSRWRARPSTPSTSWARWGTTSAPRVTPRSGGGEWGPGLVVAKQGQYGAAMISPEGFFALPAFPLETVMDPTGAGDCFAGGFMGYLAAHPGAELDHEVFARAMAYGTALASFSVEE